MNGGTITGFYPTGYAPPTVATAAAPPLAPPEPTAPPTDWQGRMRACTACTCRPEAKQVVPGTGPDDARIVVVGQNPGEDEDRDGVPFIGASGQELGTWLRLLGIDRRKVRVTNIVKCHTTGNRLPKAKEIRTCRDLWLAEELAHLPQAQVILPLGKPAVGALLGTSAPPMTPVMAHHYRVRLDGREYHVLPLPHPSYLLRARHIGPVFRETVLAHVRLTLEAECPEAYQWSK